MENKNVVLLTVISIATLLTAVVGASFAYFTTTVTPTVTNEGNKVVVQTDTVASTVTFTASNKLSMTNAIPGDTKTTTFTISNTGNNNIDYNVKLAVTTNNFGTAAENTTIPEGTDAADNLRYAIACTSSGNKAGTTAVKEGYTGDNATGNKMPAASSTTTIGSGTIAAGDSVECTVTAIFKNVDGNQNYNQGRSFEGTLSVDTDSYQIKK